MSSLLSTDRKYKPEVVVEKQRILFVGQGPNTGRELACMFRGMRRAWDIEFTNSSRQALERLASASFDVVISNMELRDVDSRQFLIEVMHRHPHVVRIVLSGYVDRESAIESLNIAHQVLARPCDAGTVKIIIDRILTLRQRLGGNTALKALVSRLESLPSLPILYTQVVQELQSSPASIHRLTRVLIQDPGMTAKILQLANSGFFNLRRCITDLPQAVALLGLDTIKDLVLTAQVFSPFDSAMLQAYPITALWHHSNVVADLARYIAEIESGDEELINQAVVAGLLHDVGKLALVLSLPSIYSKVMRLVVREGIGLTEAERCLFGVAHGEIGAYLLSLWGLPEPIVQAVGFHHHPQDSGSTDFSALTALHVANALSHEFALNHRSSTPTCLDRAYLKALGLDQRVEWWRNICRKRLAEVSSKGLDSTIPYPELPPVSMLDMSCRVLFQRH